MPTDVQLNDMEFFLSLLPQVGVGTPRLLTADFVGGLLNAIQPPVPDTQRTADAMVGAGTERAQRLKRGWQKPIRLPIAGAANSETCARIGNRALGGTRTPSAELSPGSGAYDVVTNTQTKLQGRILPVSTVGFDLGRYNYVHADMMVTNFEMAFEGEGDVTFTSEMVNTGRHRRNATAAMLEAIGYSADYAAALAIGVALIDPPAPPTHHTMHPAATKVTFSDGELKDFAADGTLISGACGINNAVLIKQRGGDPFLVPTDRKSGAVARRIKRGTRVPMARLKVDQDAMDEAYILAQNGTDITSLTFLFRSDDKIGNSAYYYELEWKCPLAEIETVDADPDGDDAAYTLLFYPKTDPLTGGYWIQRVRTDNQNLQ